MQMVPAERAGQRLPGDVVVVWKVDMQKEMSAQPLDV
jgi:hypothetical protein